MTDCELKNWRETLKKGDTAMLCCGSHGIWFEKVRILSDAEGMVPVCVLHDLRIVEHCSRSTMYPTHWSLLQCVKAEPDEFEVYDKDAFEECRGEDVAEERTSPNMKNGILTYPPKVTKGLYDKVRREAESETSETQDPGLKVMPLSYCVFRQGNPLYDETAVHVSLDTNVGGAFIRIKSLFDEDANSAGVITLDPEDLDEVSEVARFLLDEFDKVCDENQEGDI